MILNFGRKLGSWYQAPITYRYTDSESSEQFIHCLHYCLNTRILPFDIKTCNFAQSSIDTRTPINLNASVCFQFSCIAVTKLVVFRIV